MWTRRPALRGAVRVSPVERSSASRQYRRLNRGGDRQANAALHRIVQTRLRVDPRTQEYYERRSKEGKTRREIVRASSATRPGRFSTWSNLCSRNPRHRGSVRAARDEKPRRCGPAGF
ncbi:transposase [Streptomyces sp. NPDC058960]|uniref:transposase n=1 Tax=Streptomyces sp. NPDC058960 TaxID=3346679 RepID=UPI0036CE14A4